MVEKNVIHV